MSARCQLCGLADDDFTPVAFFVTDEGDLICEGCGDDEIDDDETDEGEA